MGEKLLCPVCMENLEYLRTQLESRWVPVSERLPKEGQRVLYYFDMVGIHSGLYYGDNCFGGHAGFLTDDVTHWMPLPEPPQQQGEGE